MKEYSACYSEDVIANAFAAISSGINEGLKREWREKTRRNPRAKTQTVPTRFTEKDFEAVWRAVGALLQESVGGDQGKKAVLVGKLGTFSFDGKKSSLHISNEFVRACKARQRRGGKPPSITGSRFSFLALSQETGHSKEICRKVVESVVHQLQLAVKTYDISDLVVPSLGVFKCKRKICEFDFGSTNEFPTQQEERRDVPSVEPLQRSLPHQQDQVQAPVAPPTGTRTVQNDSATQWQNEPKSLERLRKKIFERGGSDGIHSIGRVLKIMDDSSDKKLSRDEFKYGLQDYGVRINPAEVDELFSFFDQDRSGSISFDEFLVGLRRPMNKRRTDLIKIAFGKLDKNGDGRVTIEDIEMAYDARFHPDVKAGRVSPADGLRQFLNVFDSGEKDGIVTPEEFQNYYKGVSASIDDDDYFELMMRNAWHISGGKGQYENTANRRVLVQHADGRQTVEEVKDDLEDSNELAGQLTLTTNIWQGRFDELVSLVQAGGQVDPSMISEIRNRSLASGS